MPTGGAVVFLAVLGGWASGASSHAGPAPPRVSHVCVSKFETPEDWASTRWDAITDLGQAVNPLVVSPTGSVGPSDAAAWPMGSMVAAAHGNRTRITATIHPASKPAAAAFLALPPGTIAATAAKAVGMILDAGYDGVQLDWEGLQIGSEAGFERFVAGCAAALKRRRRRRHFMGLQNSSTTSTLPTARPTLSVTVYAPKLVYKDFGPYNLRALSELADQIFVMGYDMAPLGVKVGDGWKQAGPQAPLDGLAVALTNAVAAGAPASSLVLGLPLYGKLYICDGSAVPTYGNCSCGTNLRIDRTLDLIATASTQGVGATRGYDIGSATPWTEWPTGSGITGVPPASTHTRQQAWYEDARSLGAKIALAEARGLAGIGAWTAHGALPTSSADGDHAVWDTMAAYLRAPIQEQL